MSKPTTTEIVTISAKSLFQKHTYVDINYQDTWRQGFILDISPAGKYNVIFLIAPDKTMTQNEVPSKQLSFYGANDYQNDNIIRETILNEELKEIDEDNEILKMLKYKLKEIGIDQFNDITENYDFNINLIKSSTFSFVDEDSQQTCYTGYYTYQFFSGFLLDCFSYMNQKLSKFYSNKKKVSIPPIFIDFFQRVLNLIVYSLKTTGKNLNILLSSLNNRQSLIINQNRAILVSFEIILNNIILFFWYDWKKYANIDKSLQEISNLYYEIFLNSKIIESLPIKIIVSLINFITNDNVNYRILKYDKIKAYKIFSCKLNVLRESEIKAIKNFEEIKFFCSTVTTKLFKVKSKMLTDKCYLNFLLNCMSSEKSLAKKINIMNAINNEIMLKSEKNEIDLIFYEFLINKKKFLNIFFAENTHEELLKRSTDLFIYLAKFDKISDEIISKLLKMKSNKVIMKKIICEILKNTKEIDRKNELYKKISKSLGFNQNIEDIEFAAQLTSACLYQNPDNNKNNQDKKNNFNNKNNYKSNSFLPNKNNNHAIKSNINSQTNPKKNDENTMKYYGLETLFKYIIHGFVGTKNDINSHLSQAIDSFCKVLNDINNLSFTDIYYFMERTIKNIRDNQEHNSIVQSLILLKKLILKIFDLKSEKIEIIKNAKVKLFYKDPNEGRENLKKLNNKYKIISLLIDDLIRYMKIIPKKNRNDQNSVYEGVYTHNININERLDMIFFYSLNSKLKITKSSIIRIYNIFKEKIYKAERKEFFKILVNNLNNIDDDTLLSFFKEIIEKDEEFDVVKFNDEYTFALIIQIFTKVNLYLGSLTNDKKNIRVVTKKLDQIEGLDLLFNIIFKNINVDIQKRTSKILTHLCLYIDDYSNTEYWDSFLGKIRLFLEICDNFDNLKNLAGLVQLLGNIYFLCTDFCGKVPTKEDTQKVEGKFSLYHFIYHDSEKNTHKEYKLHVGINDKIIDMRWKLGYYYDININNLVLFDNKGNKYNFIDDNKKFQDVFPPKKYAHKDSKYPSIEVKSIKDQILEIKGNPKELIDNDQKIFDILLKNLSISVEKEEFDAESMQKIWELIMKLPKKSFIKDYILKYGDQNKILKKKELSEIFNIKEKYKLTFTLDGILDYLYKDVDLIFKEKDKKLYVTEKTNFVLAFINIQHIDQYLYNILLEFNLPTEKNNTETIEFRLLTSLIKTLKVIENCKINKYVSFNFKRLENENIDNNKTTICIMQKSHEEEEEFNRIGNDDIDTNRNFYLNQTKENLIETVGADKFFNRMTSFIKYTININFENLINLDKKNNEFNESKVFNLLEIIKNDTNYYNNENEAKSHFDIQLTTLCKNLLETLIKFIDEICVNNNIDYFQFLFENPNLFKKIFVFDYIKCQKEELKNILFLYLQNNLFGSNNPRCIKNAKINEKDVFLINMEYINNYLNIILTEEIFKYLVKNDIEGVYFKKISEIIAQYLEGINKNNLKEENIKFCQKNLKQLEQIIDLIIDYFKIESESPLLDDDSKNSQKESKMKGIISFAKFVLIMYPQNFILYFKNKVNITDLFFNKYIFKKCNQNPLDTNNEFSYGLDVKKEIMELLIFLMQHSEYSIREKISMEIWDKIDTYHKIGFWKTNKKKDWELDYRESPRNKFVGLKNMSCTCYLNSIIQQIFMIPMLRETILSINLNPSENSIINIKDTVLYQLQIVFASLKTFDCKYYDPRQFVVKSKLNFYEQKDADEYYSQLINTLENDIKNYYFCLNSNADDKIGVSENYEITARSNKFIDNPYKDLFKFFFGIKVVDILSFVECGHKRYNEFYYNNIPLEVKGCSSIIDSLKDYCKTEIMEGENKIICEQCKTKRICHKRQLIKQLPNILVIVLKRFEFNYEKMTKFKLNNYLEFPFELDMSDYLFDTTENDTNYELTGITIHYGVADAGHYYDLIKNDNKWYMFNDTNVTEFKEENIPSEAFGENNLEETEKNKDLEPTQKVKKNAYILVYTKKDYENDYNDNNFDTLLVHPPYSKILLINKNIKEEISYMIFKEKTLESITNSPYQNFIFNLLKIDISKKLKNDVELQNEHIDIVDELRKGGFLELDIKNDENENKNNSMQIYKYGLRYFFNVILRLPKEKDITYFFMEIFKVYFDKDKEKCEFILEEFNNKETIKEFLVSCPVENSISNSFEIILCAIKSLLKNNDAINILFQFVNGLLLFISDEINKFQFDNIIRFLYQLINTSDVFVEHLKQDKIKEWMKKVINEKNDCDEKLDERDFPSLDSQNHFILNEKVMMFDFGKKSENDADNDQEQCVKKKKDDISKNYEWLKQVKDELY